MAKRLPPMRPQPDGEQYRGLPVNTMTVHSAFVKELDARCVFLRAQLPPNASGHQNAIMILREPSDVDLVIQMLLRHKRRAWPEAG